MAQCQPLVPLVAPELAIPGCLKSCKIFTGGGPKTAAVGFTLGPQDLWYK